MFGAAIPEEEKYEVVPYWVDPFTIEMYLIDTTVSPPENPASVFDLLEQWAITSGSFQIASNYWDMAVSHEDGSFYQSVVWGYYEGQGAPQLLIGAIASWGDSSDEHSRGILDQFIPLESEGEIADWQTTVFPPVTDWTLDQVANMLAEQLAGVDGLDADEAPDAVCTGEKPGTATSIRVAWSCVNLSSHRHLIILALRVLKVVRR